MHIWTRAANALNVDCRIHYDAPAKSKPSHNVRAEQVPQWSVDNMDGQTLHAEFQPPVFHQCMKLCTVVLQMAVVPAAHGVSYEAMTH